MNLKLAMLVLAFSALSGASKAVKDTVSHHWTSSIFANLGNDQFWNPAISWKNKYANYDAGDRSPRFLLATTWLVSLTDAWHLFDNLYRVFLALAGICAGLLVGKVHGYGSAYWIRGVPLWFAFIIVVGAVVFHFLYTYVFV